MEIITYCIVLFLQVSDGDHNVLYCIVPTGVRLMEIITYCIVLLLQV